MEKSYESFIDEGRKVWFWEDEGEYKLGLILKINVISNKVTLREFKDQKTNSMIQEKDVAFENLIEFVDVEGKLYK